MARGKYPHEYAIEGIDLEFALMSIIESTPPPKLNTADGFSEDFCSFVDQCLTIESKNRPKFKDLLVSY